MFYRSLASLKRITKRCFTKDADPIVEKLYESTEEGQKVTRNKGEKFLAVFKRIPDPYNKDP